MGGKSAREPGSNLELAATVVLAIATVVTAWSAFQSAKWSGVQSIDFSLASAQRTESVRASNRANTQTAVDVDTFVAWASAVSQERGGARPSTEAYTPEPGTLSGFLFQRFRPEFKPAVQAWLNTRPLVTPDAPSSPFVMPEYKLAEGAKADRLAQRADQSRRAALQANQRSDNYVLTTVLFAAVLFFAGISTKVVGRRPRLLVFGCALALLLAGAVILATFPVQI
jgi:hypothetical protein